jgi:hypothetical protein
MADLRDRVEEDRGLLKKIQLSIPGFRGYRLKEDLRIADNMLRIQLADKLRDDVCSPLEGAREAAAAALCLDIMNDISDLISKVNTTEAIIRHAGQGYSGISPGYRIEEPELNKLYDYDLSMIDLINGLASDSRNILSNAEAGDFSSMKSACSQAKKNVVEFSNTFKQRDVVIANLGAV